ncbi:hypothetical protein BN7_6505 [Wickerhamomyces ciferrii]|uniref:RWD domain-containing protein n=1 Tax=Wickerhamomyces ciferrii (strain ATCC 14091 / BCRC 22168 / CBS 111 / JCM 3599 / NBRC 0793 / NRRL Y-1031 F-60-10) TaxID=1206466 RepID=K0KNQ1_WICCF|nr:uncharacterized protein BN7_6505 [Wickerhamomyces ciferrii]CCH46900.1 hypothetical protein BN7_6505 [Wickerhamomyces ciferrii]
MVSDDLRDELDAIEAIYPECLVRMNDNLIDLKIPQHEEFIARISFPESYPQTDPPHILQVRSNGHDDQYLETLFNEVLDSIFVEGNVCIFDFCTELEGILYIEEEPETSGNVDEVEEVHIDSLEGWTISDPITDRGSTFIGFVRKVESEHEANEKLALLKMDKKVSKANHNMVAYRIQNSDNTRVQDYDDDGETAAGGRLLHLLTVMDVWNVIVVVSRWFGGTHIGPDRFKHINKSASESIVKAGLVDDSKRSKKKRK